MKAGERRRHDEPRRPAIDRGKDCGHYRSLFWLPSVTMCRPAFALQASSTSILELDHVSLRSAGSGTDGDDGAADEQEGEDDHDGHTLQ
jgi:hypothetical protein